MELDLLSGATWEYRSTSPGAAQDPAAVAALDPTVWRQALVPGTAAGADRQAGLDPDCIDYDAADWWFSCRFSAPAEELRIPNHVLQLEGLATIADVWVNGRHVLHSQNMFRSYEVEHRTARRRQRTSGPLLLDDICARTQKTEAPLEDLSHLAPEPQVLPHVSPREDAGMGREPCCGRSLQAGPDRSLGFSSHGAAPGPGTLCRRRWSCEGRSQVQRSSPALLEPRFSSRTRWRIWGSHTTAKRLCSADLCNWERFVVGGHTRMVTSRCTTWT